MPYCRTGRILTLLLEVIYCMQTYLFLLLCLEKYDQLSSAGQVGSAPVLFNNRRTCSGFEGAIADMNLQEFAEVVVLAPTGRVDHTSAEGFQSELLEHVGQCAAADKHIILDMSGIDYMSSVGLRALMIASKESKKTEMSIVVSALQPDMKEIFEISRFHFVFKTFDTTAEAIKGFSDAAVAAWSAGQED